MGWDYRRDRVVLYASCVDAEAEFPGTRLPERQEQRSPNCHDASCSFYALRQDQAAEAEQEVCSCTEEMRVLWLYRLDGFFKRLAWSR